MGPRGPFMSFDEQDRQSALVAGWHRHPADVHELAQSKNRSGLGWFLLSLLLGPIATFLIVVLDRVPRA